MSALCWQTILKNKIQQLMMKKPSPRVVVVGIGNRMLGDDAVGPVIARTLRQAVVERPALLCLDAGPTPENFTGSILRFQPDMLLMVDAADLNAPPGAIHLLDPYRDQTYQVGTHTLALSVCIHYIQASLHCEVYLLAVQPYTLQPGHGLSTPVRHSARQIIGVLAALLTKSNHVIEALPT